MKVAYIRINDRYYIGFKSEKDGNFKVLDLLVNAIQSNSSVSKVLEAIVSKWFKGKYYSTPKNYYSVLKQAGVNSTEYLKALNVLLDNGILKEEENRVYVLGKGFYIASQKEINNFE
jgi:hypothetical protein